MNGRELRTRFAVRAIDFAETFNAGLGAMSIQPGAYRPQLTAPDGPSTGGGVQAVQHVRLVAARQGFPSILVGSANQRFGTAELRSYEYIDAVHRERWRRPVPLDRGDYEDFLDAAKNFFEANQLVVTVAGPADALARSRSVIAIGVVTGFLIAAMAIWVLLHRAPAPAAAPPSAVPAAPAALP
jgi:hypothetical protein